ncbi:RNA polymerase sigma factor (plasmid) [Gemmatirosa kalamazoonensis]|uniref:RNA polymerase sigma factor n=1 Tax=Gemmatirosa kalamazoonensis TaxID=861299 RepID=W0RN78_9BACT|nr:ECF-type sigma factor [Gemmatirosa kalamazoonensis]AHG92489.1 RNA polymerase sigma factor [Gemmatirosa kalamazoonensis]
MDADLDALIRRADAADPVAAELLFATLYRELHRIAAAHLRRDGAALSLRTTTLLHEAYLHIVGGDAPAFSERGRFLAYASRAMRRLVIDYARRGRAQKRDRRAEVTLTGDEQPSAEAARTAAELERLDDALEELATLEPALAELVNLHFFSGLTFAEIAALRGVSERTVQRDWRKARLLLARTVLDEA